MKILKRLSLLLLLIMSLPACNETVTLEAGSSQPEKKVAPHADPGEKLRDIMQNINLTIHDSTNVDTQTDRISGQDMEDMTDVIEELLIYAEMMSTDLPNSKFGKSDIVTFRALAGQLYNEAFNIQQITRDYNYDTYDYELLNRNYRRLNETCTTCHQMFRDK